MNTDSPRNVPVMEGKAGCLREIVERRGNIARVMVCVRRDGNALPEHLRERSEVGLDVAVNFGGGPAVDLEISDWGFHATLSFNRTPFRVAIPWANVFAMLDQKQGDGIGWRSSEPTDEERAPLPVSNAPIRRRGTLRLVN